MYVTGRANVPTTKVTAVVLNVTVTGAGGSGFVTVYPGSSTRPTTSSVNFAKGQTIANAVIAPVDSDGEVDLYVGGASAQLIADVSGYYQTGGRAAGALQTVSPTRLLDTRAGTGGSRGPVAKGEVVALKVTGQGGVPANGVSAVVLNVTATGATGAGFVTVYPGATTRPTTSSLNFTKGQTIANAVIAPVGSDGNVDLYVGGSATHLVADVSGYVLPGTTMVAGATQPVSPTRLLDSRYGVGAPAGIVTSAKPIALKVTGQGGVPANGVSAVVLNVTATGATGAGFVTVYPGATTRPTTSSLNFTKGQTIANAVIAPVGSDGNVDLYVGGSATHLVADVSGYVRGHNGAWGATQVIDPERGHPDTLSCVSSSFCAEGDNSGQARTFDGTTWSNATTVADDALISVSCGSSASCAALTRSGQISTFDGSSWSSPVNVFGLSSVEGAVSCTSASFCLAVGDQDASQWTGHGWSAPVQIESPNGGDLTGVSCSSPNSCVAVDSAGYALTYSAGSWGAPTSVLPGDLGAQASVSCATSTYCVAARHGSVTSFDGQSWTPALEITPGGSPLSSISCPGTTCHAFGDGSEFTGSGSSWSAQPLDGLSSAVRGSCPTDKFCAAIDYNGYAATSTQGTWSAAASADPASGGLLDVSCATSTSCTAVDANGAALTYDGHSWSNPVPVRSGASFFSVSCPTVSFCMTVGDRYTGPGYAAETARMVDGKWSILPTDDPWAPAYVSCTSATFCKALDDAGEVITYDGDHWSEPVNVFHASPAGSQNPTGISCVSVNFCVAANGASTVWTWDGSTWSGPLQTASASESTAISCTSVTFCALGTRSGPGVVYDGATRTFDTSGSAFPGIWATSLDCLSSDFCAGAMTFNPALFDGQAWRAADDPTGVPPQSANTQVAVNCASTSLCVAVGGAYAREWTR